MDVKTHKFKGWIALDIDGTITLDRYSVPDPVVAFLKEKVREGWRIAMATGRPVTFATLALSKFDFPFLFLPQNGSVVLEMPQKRCLFKRYMDIHHLSALELAFEGIASDFIIYSGYENQDRVYWRPARFDADQTTYLKALWERQKEEAIPVHSLKELQEPSVPLVKCFGTLHEMQFIAERLRKSTFFTVALLRDPFVEGYFLLLVTDRMASKGLSFTAAIELLGQKGIVIAAGDDENDTSLLEAADIAIAMAHAPECLQSLADFIAPPTSEYGIIQALQLAMRKNGF